MEPAYPLDLDYIRTMEEAIGYQPGEFIKDIGPLFLSPAPTLMEQIKTACDARDSQTLSRSAHTLVSSSGNIAASNLAAIAKNIENLADAGKLAQASGLVQALEQEYAVVVSEITHLINQ